MNTENEITINENDEICGYVYDINFDMKLIEEKLKEYNKRDVYSLNRFRSKHMNSYWCDFCLSQKFMHNTSSRKFIDKCIKLYDKYDKQFFSRKEAHMIGSMISIDIYSHEYLKDKKQELFEKYVNSYKDYSFESSRYVIEGIIHQYNERIFLHNTNIILGDENKTYDEMDKWLIKQNIQCDFCKKLACPFHTEYCDFGPVMYQNKKIFCCGWCKNYIEAISLTPVVY